MDKPALLVQFLPLSKALEKILKRTRPGKCEREREHKKRKTKKKGERTQAFRINKPRKDPFRAKAQFSLGNSVTTDGALRIPFYGSQQDCKEKESVQMHVREWGLSQSKLRVYFDDGEDGFGMRHDTAGRRITQLTIGHGFRFSELKEMTPKS
ncbi:hypothetical protein TNCV_3757461 [Trichonephila clavipes]|nr:hypothetical protein TNCV_3757461 [Trichonephila clavipes]